MSAWTEHKAEWISCQKCSYCETRNKVVLGRGVIPADVLFIGEAPGPNENAIGKAFIGPAGKALDSYIEAALKQTGIVKPAMFFSNLVGCIPYDLEASKKFMEPSKEVIEACQPRILQVIEMCKPSIIVRVGNLAKKHIPNGLAEYTFDIVHPAAILRADEQNRGLLIQNCVLTLADMLDAYIEHGEVPF